MNAKTKDGILFLFLIVSALSATTVNAMANWGAPPAPGGVPVNLDTAITKMTNWILGFISIASVLVVIWGGVNYLTSAGNEDLARTGKDTIKYGLMGLIIAGLAYALINVIITTVLVP